MGTAPPPTIQLEQSRSVSYGRRVSWLMIGNLGYAACQWGLLMAMAKLGSPVALGEFTLGLAIASPLFLFSNLQLKNLIITNTEENFQLKTYLGVRLCSVFVTLVVIAGIVGALPIGGPGKMAVVLVAGSKAVEALSDVFQGALQRQGQANAVAISLLSKGLGGLTAVILGMAITHTLWVALAGLVAAWALSVLVVDLPLTARAVGQSPSSMLRGLRSAWQPSEARHLAKNAFGLGAAALLLSLNTNIPRYVLEHAQGAFDLGIYAAAAYLLVVGNTVISAMGQTTSQQLARDYVKADWNAFERLLAKQLVVSSFVGFSGILVSAYFGEWLLRHLYQAVYAAHSLTLSVLAVAGALSFVASVLGYGLTAAQIIRPQPYLFGAVAVTTAVSACMLIPRFGILGAAMALIPGSLLQIVGSAALLRLQRSYRSAPSPCELDEVLP